MVKKHLLWINSLFEDNAEFGYGIHESYKDQRNKIKEIMYKTKDEVDPLVKATYKEWIDNMEDDDITNAIKEIDTYREECIDNYKKYGSISVKLSIAVGFMVVIILL